MGEVRALEVRDVDFDRRRLLVRRAFSGDESLTPKSGHEREVPMSADLEARLRAEVRRKFPRDHVVLDDLGRTPRRQEVLRLFKRRCTTSGSRSGASTGSGTSSARS